MKSTEASNNTRSLKQAIQTPRPTLISMLQCLTFAIFLAPEQFTRAKVADKNKIGASKCILSNVNLCLFNSGFRADCNDSQKG